MRFLVIMYAVFAFMFVVVIFGAFGRRADFKQHRINSINNTVENPAFMELNQSFYKRMIAPTIKKIKGGASKLLPKKKEKKKTSKNKNQLLERQLRLAGMYVSPEEFSFAKTLVLIFTILATVLVILVLRNTLQPLIMLLIMAFGLLVGVMGPTYYLRSRVSSHQKGIRNQLPDAMDLLGVCIEAGLSFDSSLLKIAEKMQGPFIDELMIVYREMQMGRSRREALRNLSNVSDIEELKTFASALAQAEQLGIPINNVMRVQSEQLRQTRSQQAQEKGNKASVKMLIPMLLFIFPVVFIILMGPTVMNVIETFSST